VPHEAGLLGQVQPSLATLIVEETQFDALGDFGEQREVDSGSVV
jgi:hypothetical protein